MLSFLKTVCIDKDSYDGEEYYYDEFAYGDYITFALFEVTDHEHPKLIMCGDNTHKPIEQMIECFIEGVRYCYDIEYSDTNVLMCEDESNPNLLTDTLVKCIDLKN